MSHFYGIISNSARKNAPTARAHNGLTVEAQSFQGKIVTTLTREEDSDGHWVDYYEVWRKPHQGSGGEAVILSRGRIDQPLKESSDLKEPTDISGDFWEGGK